MSRYFVLVIAPLLMTLAVCKAGSCPPTLPVDLCEAACGPTTPCNGTQLCCPTACGGAMCVDAMSQRHFVALAPLLMTLAVCKAGSCPPTLPVDLCEAACGPTTPCNGTQLCCPTACGGAMCVDAMSQRHFVALVKKGRCPEYPRGPWICTHTCTGDSDCPRTLKCCHNRCGALTCQKPEVDNAPLPSPA